jgi:beta-galactosidase
MNGADSHTGKDYHPDTTSYDYNAPLDEAGNPRYKYGLLANVIAEVTGQPAAPAPTPSVAATFPVSPIRRSASLWDNLPTPVRNRQPMTFEELDQNFGYVLYRVPLAKGQGGTLSLKGMHSYAQVYVDRKLIGTLDRRLDQETIDLPRQAGPATLDILVENTGRVNYSHAIRTEQTGLTGAVTLAGQPLQDWRMFRLPMNDLSSLRMTNAPCTGPCFYEAEMTVDRPADTYLDMRGAHKGQLWLGDHNLGRFWSIGPIHTLYTPAPWLRQGANRITFFDLTGDASDRLTTVAAPVFGKITNQREAQ